MSDRLSTKAGVFESGEKDVMGVQYKDGRVIACRNSKLEEYTVADGTEVICDRAFMNLKELRKSPMIAQLLFTCLLPPFTPEYDGLKIAKSIDKTT